jgi:hypothetical protein
MTKFLASFNWVVWLAILVAIETQLGNGTMSLANMLPDAWIPFVKAWAANLGSVGALILAYNSTDADRPASPIDRAGLVKVLLVAIALSTLLAPGAFAADNVPASPPQVIAAAPIARGYPSTKCGYYYGIGTGGNAGKVDGGVVGAQIVQGNLDGIVGYTCPFATEAFWFAEASFGFSNLNGSSNGLALSGPMVAIERVGVGSPINSLLGALIPANVTPALPSIPLLPAGVTTSPGNGYAFLGLVEQDIGAQIGLLHGHQWVIAPLFGIGVLTRASNNVMIDTWAGVQTNSQSFCPGGGSACARLGTMARIGASFKY